MTKVTKKVADYKYSPKGSEQCSVCTMFHNDSCSAVEGTISPYAWCRFFKRKVNEDSPVNSMGHSSSSQGPIQTFDPLLTKKKLKRFKNIVKPSTK